MKFHLDKILRECVEQAYEGARLGRGDDIQGRDGAFCRVLEDLEISGDAMRYLNSKGQVAWKATPQLHDYMQDLRLDAEAEFEAEDV